MRNSDATLNRGDAPDAPPRMRRRRTGRVVGGVAGGLADHLGTNVLWVRATFAVLAGFAGAGLLAYALLWTFVRLEPVGATEREISPRERQQAFAVIALGTSVGAALSVLSGMSAWIVLPVGVVLIGATVVWREADATQRRRWVDGARSGFVSAVFGRGGRAAMLRVIAGAGLVVAGIAVLLAYSIDFSQIQSSLVAVLATLAGVAVLTVPWWLRLVRDLGDERMARIRTEERAVIAAHLHDSVLQTLALIQRQAEVPREVLRLARGQERELRSWLYGSNGYGQGRGWSATGEPTGPTTLAEAITLASGEVEDAFAVAVRPVVVGDCPMDERLLALAQAAREAMVNAAKHSGAVEISVYAEVEPEQVTIFVRDRGKGFDLATVPADRRGLADSIRGRIYRHGGTATVRTAIGAGTEVRLAVPRTTGPRTTGPRTTGPRTTGPRTTGPRTTGPRSTVADAAKHGGNRGHTDQETT